jgi:hypothetical protein
VLIVASGRKVTIDIDRPGIPEQGANGGEMPLPHIDPVRFDPLPVRQRPDGTLLLTALAVRPEQTEMRPFPQGGFEKAGTGPGWRGLATLIVNKPLR